ncbi:unnamed protein product [Linum tenue]|uniref:Uncharacterized protein n=1 Tax=Linum tenue TaxID=586396 RepID=A0AAV0MYL0_9ROSI|nr:unnamed protein product [Linum tenue]
MAMELNTRDISVKPLSQFPSSSSQHPNRETLFLKPSIFSSVSVKLKLSASAAEPVLSQQDTPLLKEKLRVVVKPMEKPRIVLKFLWMEDVIGVALDQVIPRHGPIPLTPYHFWPHQDALVELQKLLESKPWISHKQMTILLNQLADLISKGKATTNKSS